MADVRGRKEATGRRTDRGGNARTAPWSNGRRLSVSLPIFIILIGLLVSVSNLTTVPWDNEPTGQTIATLSRDTAVTFRAEGDGGGETDASGGESGLYQVEEESYALTIARDGTQVGKAVEQPVDPESDATWQVQGKGEDATQTITMLVRRPAGASGTRPAILFMHGAGFGTAYNSFGDMAETLASAGFVTAVIDKPVWDTTDVNRDYPASARAYDAAIRMLRKRADVDAAKIGIYATSESTWISQYLLAEDHDVAFQVLLSPMVFTPRRSLGFFISQDFALVGANDGYQSIVRRVFNADTAFFGLDNFDLDLPESSAYAIPTLVAYGSKDVMTAQVEGVERILREAHKAGNWDVTVRSYPVANHVLRLGDEAESGTRFADAYVDDVVSWTSGVAAGRRQTSERVAGDTIYQSIAVPDDLQPRRSLTVYGAILHAGTILLLVATAVAWLAALGRRIRFRLCRANRGVPYPGLGFRNGFGNALITLTVTTMATLLLFAAGLGQVVMGVVKLAWGAAPAEQPGVMWWSWPVIQVVSTLVVWAWSRVFARLIEVAVERGMLDWPPRPGAIRGVVTGAEPVLAATRFGRVLFWLTAVSMLHVLFFFAFWGLFIY
ncbi:alpha/beta hydrolase family protein [Bifidobacterium saguinibicoloris]|uniref:alpha/beta hydrolase family protein n=1 Tax=Bifidobacterium saguinibicoloris TaxID=2834433 RepID=UPI001F1BDE9B|nr:alpha/beta hydrolase [Bifidobacterium saguinibicoloris]